jgi:hypothetical protein
VHRDDPARLHALHDGRGLLGVDRRAAADREEDEIDVADRLGLLVAQGALAEVAEVRDADAVEIEDEDRVGPRLVPAWSSCSEAMATTSPIGDSRRPAVERRTTGSPSIRSTPLWSACSWVTSSRSAPMPSIGG